MLLYTVYATLIIYISESNALPSVFLLEAYLLVRNVRDCDLRLQPHVALTTRHSPQPGVVVVQCQGACVSPIHLVPEGQARVVVPPDSQQGAVQLGCGACCTIGTIEVDVRVGTIFWTSRRTRLKCFNYIANSIY